MRARSLFTRVAVAITTIAALSLGSVTATHAAPSGITINDVSITEGDSGTSTLSFTLQYGGGPAAGVTVDYATANVTATAGSDYTTTSGTAALPNGGCNCTTVDVPIIGDAVPENTETFQLNLSNPVNKTLDDNQGIGTLTDNDMPNATIDDPSVAENGGPMTFTVTLDRSAPFDSVIGYSTAAGTATAGSDYTSVSNNLTIIAGSTTGTIDVPILDDSIYEGNETVLMNLTVVSGVAIADSQGVGTITEDEAKPDVTVDDPTVPENGGPMIFTISLNTAAAVDASVNYATSNNGALAGSDYTAKSGTATITSGSTSTTVNVAILDDSVYEGDEAFTLDLSGVVNGTLVDGEGQGTITDDESPPTISVDSPTVGEADGTMTFTVSIDAAADVDTSVDYATTEGSATDGSDYTGQTGTATITKGSTSTTVDVPVLDDSVYEGNEDLTLDLSDPIDGQFGVSTGTGTITEDDPAPTISVDSPTVGEADGTMTFTVSIDAAADVDTSVDYATAEGSATDGSDYTGQTGTATITKGSTSTTVDVPVLDDSVYEGDEDLTLDLSDPINGQFGVSTGTGTINDDDSAPGVSVDDASVTEGNSGTKNLTFTVSLTNATTSDVSVHYATSDGTATAPGDYQAKTGTLTIPAGDTTGEIQVVVKGETTFEPDETLTVTLADLVGGSSIDDAAATGTITNDDKQPSSLTLKVVKTHSTVKAKGLLEPASTGNQITVILAKYKNGTWVKLAAKTVSVRKIGDRDHDGKKDGGYAASFPRPAKGRYRFAATFAGDANTAPKTKKVIFKL
jgi:hypothetical protein